jgi:hypothetical protein
LAIQTYRLNIVINTERINMSKNDTDALALGILGFLCPPLLIVMAVASLLGAKPARRRERPDYHAYHGIKVMAMWWTEKLRPLVANEQTLGKFQKELTRLLGDQYAACEVFSYVRCSLHKVSWWDGHSENVLYQAARKSGIPYETVLACMPAGPHSVAYTSGSVHYARGDMIGHKSVFASHPGVSSGWIWIDPAPLPVV